MTSQTVIEMTRAIKHWPGRVLVGFDGSHSAAQALDWAIREAAARGSSLRVGSSARRLTSLGSRAADDLGDTPLARVAHELHQQHPSLVVELAATHGDARRALIEEAGDADLLVLAAYEESAHEALVGSLARKALRRSPCPVVVVRGSSQRPIQRIVIGVDGSSAADAAVDWACDEANLHRAELLVIHAGERDISRAEARCVLELAVNECKDRTGATVRGVLIDGSPASALIDASRSADLVAVGSRGRSGFKTALFGSVALSVAEGSHCPVAVTHPGQRYD